MRNGYAAMGNSLVRPRYAGLTGRSIGESIARERAKAQKAANIKKK